MTIPVPFKLGDLVVRTDEYGGTGRYGPQPVVAFELNNPEPWAKLYHLENAWVRVPALRLATKEEVARKLTSVMRDCDYDKVRSPIPNSAFVMAEFLYPHLRD